MNYCGLPAMAVRFRQGSHWRIGALVAQCQDRILVARGRRRPAKADPLTRFLPRGVL